MTTVRPRFSPIYDFSYERLMKTVLLDYLDRQAAVYRARVKEFEKRHGSDFDRFTRRLEGQASMADEEEWMDWEEALIFWRKWQQIRERVAGVARMWGRR